MLPTAKMQRRRQTTKDKVAAGAARLVATGCHRPGSTGNGESKSKPPSVAPGGLTELRKRPVHEDEMHGGPSVFKHSRSPLEQPLAERSPECLPSGGAITGGRCWVKASPAAVVSTITRPIKGVALAIWNRATSGSLHCLRIKDDIAEGTPRARRRRPVLHGTHMKDWKSKNLCVELQAKRPGCTSTGQRPNSASDHFSGSRASGRHARIQPRFG